VNLELECNPANGIHETLTGILTPELGYSVLIFNTSTGMLNQGPPFTGNTTDVIGTDSLIGPEKDEIITSQEFPGIDRCVKVRPGTGRYRTSSCEGEEVRGGKRANYEWLGGAVKNKFTSKEGATAFESVSGSKITCKSSVDTAEYVGESEDRETITFSGCEALGEKCTTAGLPAGEIQTKLLRSLYGFIKHPADVGVSLEPATGTVWAEFSCGKPFVVIRGSVIAPVTPVSKMTKTFKETFAQTGGHQEPESFEGAAKDVLETSIAGGAYEQTGFSSTDTVKNEEKLELREI